MKEEASFSIAKYHVLDMTFIFDQITAFKVEKHSQSAVLDPDNVLDHFQNLIISSLSQSGHLLKIY